MTKRYHPKVGLMEIRIGATYFFIVFFVGFLLGICRVLLLAPLVGESNAEIIEAPFMIIACFFAARWVVFSYSDLYSEIKFLEVGIIALALLLVAEVGVVLLFRDQSVKEYILSREKFSGLIYLFSLLVFALLPLVVSRNQGIQQIDANTNGGKDGL